MEAMAANGASIEEPARARQGDVRGRRARLTAEFMTMADRLQSGLAAARVAPRPQADPFAPASPQAGANNALVVAPFAPMPATPVRRGGPAGAEMALIQQQQQQQWGQVVSGLSSFAQRHEASLARQEANQRDMLAAQEEAREERRAAMAAQEEDRAERQQANAAILAALNSLATLSSPAARTPGARLPLSRSQGSAGSPPLGVTPPGLRGPLPPGDGTPSRPSRRNVRRHPYRRGPEDDDDEDAPPAA